MTQRTIVPPPSGPRSPKRVAVLDNMGILHRYELLGWGAKLCKWRCYAQGTAVGRRGRKVEQK